MIRPSIQITLTTEGPGPDLPIRLRRFLKGALRGYGLRCVKITAAEDPTMPIAGDGRPKTRDGRDEPHD